MSEQKNSDHSVCNTGEPVTTVDVGAVPDIQPGITDDAPLKDDAAAAVTVRRAQFASVDSESSAESNRGTGGLDSLGGGNIL